MTTNPTRPRPGDKRILIMDDDDAILMLLKTTFEIEGFNVKTGKSGRDILRIAIEYKPDLIITDLMMPGVGGYDVLRSLQSDPSTSKVPVFIITGSHMNDSTKGMLKQESNMAAYFEKPCRPEKLTREAHKILNTISLAEQHREQDRDVPTNFKDIF